MPKREKSPTPDPELEPKFLSIYYPFPLYVTLEEEKDTINCAKWLASFIGQDYMYAMFHKPSSPNVIIVEISNELTDTKMRNILGEHDWDKVFPSYAPYSRKEGYTKSQVFYSVFRTRREVEKTGWKIVEVKDAWFKGFNPQKTVKVNHPYPPTKFCEPPEFAEESSGALRLFRFLPAKLFPEAAGRVEDTEEKKTAAEPTPPPRVVPGSGGLPGASTTPVNAGGKGKKKVRAKGSGNANADPNVRPAAPLARPAEASAKAKVIHKQANQVKLNVYEDDSDDDHEYYQSPTDDFGADASGANLDEVVEKVGESLRKTKIEGPPAQQYNPFIPDKPNQEIDADDICPTHKKRCKPGICEWAGERRARKKQLEKRTGGRAGQNQRRW